MRKFFSLGWLIAFTLAAPALAQQLTPPPSSAAAQASPNPTAPSVSASTSTDLEYKLGPGDKLKVTTFNELELTGEFFVGGDGIVSLPLIGDIKAGGLTVGQFRDHVVAALKSGYILDPKVSMEVLTYRPFYVLGEVTKPGEYPYVSGLNVVNAVATASGFTYRANTKRVLIKHQNEDKERDYPLSSSTVVQPGDTIRVKERFF